jgi:hypothetical protein
MLASVASLALLTAPKAKAGLMQFPAAELNNR